MCTSSISARLIVFEPFSLAVAYIRVYTDIIALTTIVGLAQSTSCDLSRWLPYYLTLYATFGNHMADTPSGNLIWSGLQPCCDETPRVS